MPRIARRAPKGWIYHALNRAVARLPLFQKDAAKKRGASGLASLVLFGFAAIGVAVVTSRGLRSIKRAEKDLAPAASPSLLWRGQPLLNPAWSQVARFYGLLRKMPDREHLDCIAGNAVESTVSEPLSALIMNFSQFEADCARFRSYGPSPGIAFEFVNRLQEPVVPRGRNLERLRPFHIPPRDGEQVCGGFVGYFEAVVHRRRSGKPRAARMVVSTSVMSRIRPASASSTPRLTDAIVAS